MALEPMLILNDSHRPYHDKRAWAIVMKVGRALKPHHLIVDGDYLDCHCISSHSKDPSRVRNLQWEIADGNKGLDELDSLKAKNKLFAGGNHEDRLRRYLEEKAPELFGIVDIPQLLNLGRRGWEYVPYKAYATRGKLHITHDVGNAGRNSTFRALDTFQHSVVTGHAHRMQYVVEGNAVGEHKLSAQFGWLGDLKEVGYMHRSNANKNWALGFGIGYLDPKSGIAYLTPVPIVKYTCVVNGRLFRG